MFGKQCLKRGSTALVLFAALVAGGCVTTTYTQTAEDTKDLSQEQARKLLIEAVKAFNYWCIDPTNVSANYKKIRYTCPGSTKETAYRFTDLPKLVVKNVNGKACVSTAETEGQFCDFTWQGIRAQSIARDFVRAWYVLAHTSAVDPAQEAAFEHAAQSYRNAAVKPQLPEEAVRYKVQAELAVQQKRFDDAVDLYDKALGIALWWPAGHYNRGLILGELKDYEEGIRALQKYLKLEPNASNARAVQHKIYEWESLVPRAAK